MKGGGNEQRANDNPTLPVKKMGFEKDGKKRKKETIRTKTNNTARMVVS